MRALLLIIASCCAFGFTQEQTLRLEFGVYPTDRATVMYRQFSPILDAIRVPIENQLHREVDIHLTIFKNYESGIEALAKGEIDFVRFGPSSYILAEQMNPEIKMLAMELQKGLNRFNGLIIAHKDSNITTLQDLQGKTFAFGDERSTIGRFLAQSLMVDNEINADSLASFEYLGKNDYVAHAVMTKSHDAGAVDSSTYKKLCDPDEIIIVQAFSNVTKPWVAKSTLPKEICDAITFSLLMLEDQEIIGELGCSGFTEAHSRDYDLVRKGMENAEAFNPKAEDEPED